MDKHGSITNAPASLTTCVFLQMVRFYTWLKKIELFSAWTQSWDCNFAKQPWHLPKHRLETKCVCWIHAKWIEFHDFVSLSRTPLASSNKCLGQQLFPREAFFTCNLLWREWMQRIDHIGTNKNGYWKRNPSPNPEIPSIPSTNIIIPILLVLSTKEGVTSLMMACLGMLQLLHGKMQFLQLWTVRLHLRMVRPR